MQSDDEVEGVISKVAELTPAYSLKSKLSSHSSHLGSEAVDDGWSLAKSGLKASSSSITKSPPSSPSPSLHNSANNLSPELGPNSGGEFANAFDLLREDD